MRLSEAITIIFQERGGLREKLETARGYERDARQFCVYAHNPAIEDVRIDEIERYFHEMEASGYARNGTQMKACALRKLFTGLRRRGYRVLDPKDIPMPRREFKEPKVATDADIASVLAVLKKAPQRHRVLRNIAITLLLRDTGMRCGELRALNVGDLDMDSKRAIIQTKKSRGMRPIRPVFWFDETNEALKAWIAERAAFLRKRGVKSDALFLMVHRDTGVARIGPTTIGLMLRKASYIAGVRTLNPHSLRHRKGHVLAKQGANNSIISGVLGHSSLASSYIYTAMNDHELENMARRYGDESGAK